MKKTSRVALKRIQRRYRFLQWQSKTRLVLIQLAHLLGDVGDVTDEFLSGLPTRRKLWARFFGPTRTLTPRQYKKVLRELRRRRYLEKQKGGYIYLSEKAKVEVLREFILEKQEPNEWDQRWRIVIFDIKEKKRRDRDFLRTLLRSWNFKELQQSVWVTPYDVEDELREFVQLARLHLRGDLRFIIADTVTNDSDLRDHFGLT